MPREAERNRAQSRESARARLSGSALFVIKSSSCAEHYRAVAFRFRERAAATADLQLRQSYRDVAADYERLADLAEAEDRFWDRLRGNRTP